MTGPAGTNTTTIQATINGRTVTVPAGTSILDAAGRLDIDIPTLCHHPTLKPAATCRLCVVEVEGQPDLLCACDTELSDGMVLQTESKTVVEARKLVLDRILSDHPLGCITCEQSGDCVLQDHCYRYGVEESSLPGGVRELPITDDNPMIERDMNKCILCGKCERVCDEIQVSNAIDFIERESDDQVTASFDKPVDLELCRYCGQCVDICPVGAITNKQFKGTRIWKREKVRTTCPFCGVGCNFDLNVANDKVIGVTAAYDAPVNQGSLCVKGRFHTDLIYSKERITAPMIQENGVWREATWDEALSLTAKRLLEIRGEGNLAVGVLSSARCTNEENYLLQRLTRAGLNTNSIDHCART